MTKLRLLDLFSGIGGFSLGLERSGAFETVAFCEIDPFCRRVLKKHWPEVPCYDDVRTISAERLTADGVWPNAIAGGFPCQDISFAGRGAGLEGERSGLFFEYDRLIGDVRPSLVLMENVSALLHRGGLAVLSALAARGYDAWWETIPAKAIGLPHERDRVWLLAYSDEIGREACKRIQAVVLGEAVPWTSWQPMELCGTRSGGTRWIPNSVVCVVDNGVSANLGGLGAAGNAVVPQIPELIGRAIKQSMERAA